MEEKDLIPIQRRLLAWFDVHRRAMPWREEKTPYRVWISEVMLQQTRVDTVIPYFERFIAQFPSVEHLARAEEDRLLKAWEGLGYYHRVRNLKKAALQLMDERGGTFPETAEEWARLPGIGPYASGSIASIAFDTPVPAVDGNVSRVLARLLGLRTDLRDSLSQKTIREWAVRLLPPTRVGDFNQSLMELGALVCLPHGKPLCERCPVSDDCLARQTGREDTIPETPKKTVVIEENRTVFLLENGKEFGLRKRPGKGLLAGMWELPNVLGHLSLEEVVLLLNGWGFTVSGIQPIGDAVHHFSHRTWIMTGYRVQVGKKPEGFEFATWATIGSERAVATAFRYFLSQIPTENPQDVSPGGGQTDFGKVQ